MFRLQYSISWMSQFKTKQNNQSNPLKSHNAGTTFFKYLLKTANDKHHIPKRECLFIRGSIILKEASLSFVSHPVTGNASSKRRLVRVHHLNKKSSTHFASELVALIG